MLEHLTYKQFQVLSEILEKEGLSQREIAINCQLSVGTVNKIMKELHDYELLSNAKATARGFEIMQQYRVERAVFMAAGFGSRMMPITLNTPKPLVRVHGKMLIEGLLDAIIAADINEIYIVRGYLKEQFDQLLNKYPMIKFIDNPMFKDTNNISSAFVAKEFLHNAYLLDADLWIRNPKLIKKYQYRTNYLGTSVNYTDDWCFNAENELIKNISIGGENCFKWIGLSYWTEEDGRRLGSDIEIAIKYPGGKERFWDQVALEYFKNKYKIYIRTCSDEDIVEIDSIQELANIDPIYRLS